MPLYNKPLISQKNILRPLYDRECEERGTPIIVSFPKSFPLAAFPSLCPPTLPPPSFRIPLIPKYLTLFSSPSLPPSRWRPHSCLWGIWVIHLSRRACSQLSPTRDVRHCWPWPDADIGHILMRLGSNEPRDWEFPEKPNIATDIAWRHCRLP